MILKPCSMAERMTNTVAPSDRLAIHPSAIFDFTD
jgi:hypothetical protein